MEPVDDLNTVKMVTSHVALILWTVVIALTSLGAVCIFKPPQEWTLLSTVVGALKELAFMIAGGWLALLHPSRIESTCRNTPTDPPPAKFQKFQP